MKINHPQAGMTLVELMISVVLVGLLFVLISRIAGSFFGNYSFSFEQNQATAEAQHAVTTMEREIREMREGIGGAYPLSTAGDYELVFYSDVDNDDSVERVRYYVVGTDLIKQVFEYIPGVYNYACVNGCTICHQPDDGGGGTISIPESSWPAHKGHGDYLGECGQLDPESGETTITARESVVARSVVSDGEPLFRYYDATWPINTADNPLTAENRLLHTRMIGIWLTVNIDPETIPDDFSLQTQVQLRNLKEVQ